MGKTQPPAWLEVPAHALFELFRTHYRDAAPETLPTDETGLRLSEEGAAWLATHTLSSQDLQTLHQVLRLPSVYRVHSLISDHGPIRVLFELTGPDIEPGKRYEIWWNTRYGRPVFHAIREKAR